MRTFNQSHFLQLFNTVYSFAHAGQSVNINSLNFAPKTGYMVSVANVAIYDNIQDANVTQVIDRVKQLHSGSNKNYLGIWTDKLTGKCYFDLSIWIEDMNEAIQKGLELNEIAIFDLKNSNEIRLK